MTHEERINHLRGHIMGPVWLEIIEPVYKARLQIELSALVASGDHEEETRGALEILRWALRLPHDMIERKRNARRRGRIKALRALLEWPTSEVVQDVEEKVRAKNHDAEEARWQHYAEWGFHSPVPLPEPGERETT